MKLFRKLLSSLCAGAMLVGSCIPVGATRLVKDDDSSSVEIKASYTAGFTTDVYAVDIVWGSMEFVYTDEGKVWNPDKHQYDVTQEPGWTCAVAGANEVKVTNHSNKPVTVDFEYMASSSYQGVSGEFDKQSENLDAAAENSLYEAAPSLTATLNLSGALDKGTAQNTVIGTAKVTLSVPDYYTNDNNSETPDLGNGTESSEETLMPDVMDTSTEAGSIKLSSSKAEFEDWLYQTALYKQSENVYMAELCAETVYNSAQGGQTEIEIEGTQYHIFMEGLGYEFKPGTTVPLRTESYDGKRKTTDIEAGKTYRLTITLNGDGTGEATLIEITA